MIHKQFTRTLSHVYTMFYAHNRTFVTCDFDVLFFFAFSEKYILYKRANEENVFFP